MGSRLLPRLVLPLAATGLLAAASGLLRARAQGLRAQAPVSDYDIPAFPATVVRPFSFGLRSVVADLMFIEAIQVYGSRPRHAVSAAEGGSSDRTLNRLLVYATDLDPSFAGAYRFAGNAMPRQTSDQKVTNVRQAEALLRRGVRERPDDWHLPFTLGFLQSYFLGEFKEAGENVGLSARLPGAPPYVGFLATRLLSEAGDLALAEQMAVAMEEQATEDKVREEWQERLRDLAMERHLRAIEAAAARFRARTGAAPSSLAALVRSGDLPAVPSEPHGGEYELAADGTPRSNKKARLMIRGRRNTLAGLEVVD